MFSGSVGWMCIVLRDILRCRAEFDCKHKLMDDFSALLADDMRT